jgi:hypothetical protein
MSPVKYELVFYIPEDDILHSHRRENLKSYLDQKGSEHNLKIVWKSPEISPIERLSVSQHTLTQCC